MNRLHTGFLCLLTAGSLVRADAPKPAPIEALLAQATAFEISLDIKRGPKTADADWTQLVQICKDLSDALSSGDFCKTFQLVDQWRAVQQRMPDSHGKVSISLDPKDTEKKSNERDEKTDDHLLLAYRASKADTSPAVWTAMLCLASTCAAFVTAHPQATYDEIKEVAARALCVPGAAI